MPGYLGYYSRNDSKRIDAWQAHYVAKGCSERKARQVARDKCSKSTTWPIDTRRNNA